ncbi:MAG: DUF4176 domain-containing protein [Lachnospiraceae bacterium]|nr:DUF4176 domain-containing protein [Lachnospiraceae bacterium]
MNNLLPVGSVVYLKEGNTKLVIIGICQFTKQEPNAKPVYYDYVASEYPQGLNPDNVYYFNDDSVDEVLHDGYKSEDHDRFLKMVGEWIEEHKSEFKIGKVLD